MDTNHDTNDTGTYTLQLDGVPVVAHGAKAAAAFARLIRQQMGAPQVAPVISSAPASAIEPVRLAEQTNGRERSSAKVYAHAVGQALCALAAEKQTAFKAIIRKRTSLSDHEVRRGLEWLSAAMKANGGTEADAFTWMKVGRESIYQVGPRLPELLASMNAGEGRGQ